MSSVCYIFRQAYENCTVLEARICYNVAKLMALNAERWAPVFGSGHRVRYPKAPPFSTFPDPVVNGFFSRKKTERSKKFFTDLMAKEHIPTMINPKPCGHLCCCAIAGCEEVMTWLLFRGWLASADLCVCVWAGVSLWTLLIFFKTYCTLIWRYFVYMATSQH